MHSIIHKAKATKAHALRSMLFNIEQRIIFVLIAAVVIFVLLYVYFVGMAIINTVVRKEVEHDAAQLKSTVAQLEVRYLTEKNEITVALAMSMGFVRIENKTFAQRTTYIGRADSSADGI
jgi:sensor histidine kinase regulating citrate/malate metabolism